MKNMSAEISSYFCYLGNWDSTWFDKTLLKGIHWKWAPLQDRVHHWVSGGLSSCQHHSRPLHIIQLHPQHHSTCLDLCVWFVRVVCFVCVCACMRVICFPLPLPLQVQLGNQQTIVGLISFQPQFNYLLNVVVPVLAAGQLCVILLLVAGCCVCLRRKRHTSGDRCVIN